MRAMITVSSEKQLRKWIAVESAKPKKARRGKAATLTDAQKALKAVEREKLQRRFADLWRQLGGPALKAEHRFHPTRRYRLDFVVLPVELKIGFEIDGGTWSEERTGHNWGTGITRDHEKQNLAMLAGWRIFRFTADMLSDRYASKYLGPVIRFAQAQVESFGQK